jgi:hypothetical protein
MVSPSGAKLEEGWCEMATAKPKVKHMMGGGAARPMSKAKLALRDRPDPMPPRKKPPTIYGGPDALNAYMARRGVPNPKAIAAGMGAGAARGMMKKGGAVKKATKK